MKIEEMWNMNISQSNLLKTSGATETSKKSVKADAVATSGETEAAAYHGLGVLALQIQAMESAQPSRVEELRSQIQSGQYKLDLPAASRAIVDSALNLD